MVNDANIKRLHKDILQCKICVEAGLAIPLPHQPRPVVIMSSSAKIAICGQAPGTRVHASGIPFSDPSGDRLRDWLGVSSEEFYNPDNFAIVPMGFCFPGLDANGSDLPPRRECAPAWRLKVMDAMPQLELLLIIGMHAQAWHMGKDGMKSMSKRVGAWREYLDAQSEPKLLPLPHPSWRNNSWLKKNPWFSNALLPELKEMIQFRLQSK